MFRRVPFCSRKVTRGFNARRLVSSRTAAATVKPRWKIPTISALLLSAAALSWYSIPVASALEAPGITVEELQKHTSAESVWVAINGKVYDLTGFLSRHPGGANIILSYAGKNASTIFNKYHAPNFVDKYLTPEECLGPLIGELEPEKDITEVGGSELRQEYIENMPPISEIFRVSDFEYIAKKILPPSAWYYYSSAADDEVTLRENHNAFSRIFFKPRVLVDVSNVDLSTTLMGSPASVPFYSSATAQGKLGHPDGECSIAKGCGKEGVIQMISNYSSYPLADIVGVAEKNQPQWFQVYHEGESNSKSLVSECDELGLKGIFVTVDTPELGRREKDMRLRAQIEANSDLSDDSSGAQELKSAVSYGKDTSVTWKDVEKISSWTNIPVAVKGVQSVEDVVLAAEKGVKAVVISNHGGRQLDYSRAPVEVLADAVPVLKEKGLDGKIDIFVDGGVRRGSDIIKCLALGAKGVGLGRVFLYANSCYGEEGVRKAIDLLRSEMILDMKLLGVTKISELGRQHLDLRSIHNRLPPNDNLYNGNYEPLSPPTFQHER
ncbi:uncharacterized protein CXQ87_001534 [Candidozyma duobushaemuli]|uniref:Uncharacterized protein n=2 Tax=Candidozyma TaxID=3303203 RepID=A0ABX8I5I3_9ASCO|nr:uncharacterized protein CXQ87_001534 [[Candida] duobushaemulonis]PVH18603.1 hypothetical protein CXQ87_001534 [[Candida] duobushaemulonis]QWU87123.1 hypothetical protein CA3LBN_001341 [[Candida] haemuloni]